MRQSDPPWLTCEIKKNIRKRKRLYKKYKKTKRPADFEKYKHTRNIITAEIRKVQQAVIDKLAAKLRNTDTGPRDWWKTLKQFIKPNNTTSIPLLCKDDIVHTEEADKASMMNDFFVAQTILDETNATLPLNIDHPENNLNSISTLPHEVESIRPDALAVCRAHRGLPVGFLLLRYSV